MTNGHSKVAAGTVAIKLIRLCKPQQYADTFGSVQQSQNS
jgi:hypothetical protein